MAQVYRQALLLHTAVTPLRECLSYGSVHDEYFRRSYMAVIDSVTNIVVNRVWWDADIDKRSPPDGTYVIKINDPAQGGVSDSYDPATCTFTKA